eukprot:scaffold10476_cov142-Cylindrotheca_fusiformis.AAC.1
MSQKRERTRQSASSKRPKTNACPANCPVQVLQADASKPSPPISLFPDLDDLMYPLTGGEFLEDFFRKKAVHVTCQEGREKEHAEQRVSGLIDEMFGLDPEMILRETSSENIFLWLQGKGGSKSKLETDSRQIRSIEVADVETALSLHNIGKHATYCRAPPNVEQRLVASLLKATGLGCGQYDPSGENLASMGRGEVETFISTDGHLTNWHYDFQENFTIQLSGVKRWTIQQGTIKDPVRGCTPHYAAPESVESQLKAAYLFDRKFRFGFPQTNVTARGDVVSIDVKPGDVFYFPAGMWHKVETLEPGVSINVSLMASNYAAVTCQALQHFLFKDERWRAPVLRNEKSCAVNHLKALLRELPSMIKDLERNGGAEAILPPAVSFPPRFERVDDNEDTMEEKSDSDNKKNSVSDDDGTDGSEEASFLNEDKDTILDPESFDSYPTDWSFKLKVGTKITMSKNPLAALHRLEEITSFYNSCHGESEDKSAYVLNVNFAGNEMHHSAIRVVFRDVTGRFAQMLYKKERNLGDFTIGTVVTETNSHLIKFLAFHGYATISAKEKENIAIN